MSTALVVFEHKFPVNIGHRSIVPAPFSDRSEMLPAALSAMNPESGQSDWIVLESLTETYGPDARTISQVSPGLIFDIYA